MTQRQGAAGATSTPTAMTPAKVVNPTDLWKVLDYFRYKVGTSLDCAEDTGILRNCITWYIRDLEELNLLQAVFVAPDKRTGFRAKHYSADPQKWQESAGNAQLSLFGKEDAYGCN